MHLMPVYELCLGTKAMCVRDRDHSKQVVICDRNMPMKVIRLHTAQ